MKLPLVLPPLNGALVTLRPFVAADITNAYVGWLNDARVTRFSNQRFLKHDFDSCQRYFNSFEGGDNLFVSIVRREDGKAIGTMTAYISRHHETADIGLLIGDPDTWGKGYGQDAWDTLCNWLLGNPSIRKLTAGTVASNKAMLRIMERSGMQYEGSRKDQELINGRSEDMHYFGRFKDA